VDALDYRESARTAHFEGTEVKGIYAGFSPNNGEISAAATLNPRLWISPGKLDFSVG
jgi:hypothetical protein